MTDETPDPPPPDPPEPTKAAPTFKARFEAVFKAVGAVMDQYERETPAWEAETLIDLTRGALASFWHYLSEAPPLPAGVEVLPDEALPPPPSDEALRRMGLSPEDLDRAAAEALTDPAVRRALEAGPSWALPEVELQYAVEWDWKKGTAVAGVFEAEALKDDPEKWKEAGLNVFLNSRALYVLNLLTRGARIRTNGETDEAAIPPDLSERFPDLTPDEIVAASPDTPAGAAFAARYRPFALTGYALAALSHEFALQALQQVPKSDPDLPPEMSDLTALELWARLPHKAQETFRFSLLDEAIEKLERGDLLRVEGHVNDSPFTASLHVEVHPLVLDTRKPRRAFYPVTLALAYTGAIPLVAWPDEDRRKLWDAFEETLRLVLDALQKSVRPSASPSPSPSPEPPEEVPAAVVPTPERIGGPPAERRYLHDGQTRYDRNALAVVSKLGRLHLPRKWTTLKPWPDYEQEEVARLQAEYGAAAFTDQRTPQSPNAPGKLLTRETRVVEGVHTDAVVLTREARTALRDRVGCIGFRERRRDKDGRYREYLVKRFRVSGGYVETSLSWYGEAWPLVDEGREQRTAEVKKLRDQFQQRELFEDLGPDLQDRINGELTRLGAVRDGRRVMEYILGLLSKDARNPVKIGAWELRTLLECETDPDGFDRVRGCLRALQELRYHLKVAGVPNLSQDAVGPFLGDVEYVGRGVARHTDGEFFLTVSPYFVGSLRVFENTTPRLRDARAIVGFEWGKDLSEEDHKALAGKFLKGFSALSPFFDRAKGFTDTQIGLRQFLEHEITLRRDPARKAHRSVRVAPTAQDANEPRIYLREFCPFLLPDRQYHGALGHFSKNPETGRKLMGTARPGTSTSGPHSAGLLQEMGYPALPRGGAHRRRDALVQDALQDLRAVVEEAFGGVVAGWHGGTWYSLQTATEVLDVDTLARSVSWFLFLAHDWRDRMTTAIETHHADRHARGETPYRVAVTTDRALAERDRADTTEAASGRIATPADVPLLTRFIARRERLRLTREAVGRLFGVSKTVVRKWETKQAPIPADVVPLVARWVEDGTPPTPEDLARLAARRAHRPGVKKVRPETSSE